MDLTIIRNTIGHAEPIQFPVSELTMGTYIFNIPSYQRGYRWESSEPNGNSRNEVKQVDDLLNDLTSFAQGGGQKNYYLQPLMVKPHQDVNGHWVWDVLDGQQRLTTMLLIMKCLNEKLHSNNPFKLFEVAYERSRTPDFKKIAFDSSNPNYNYPLASTGLDFYYVKKAKDRIEEWYNNTVAPNTALQRNFDEMLFDPDNTRNPNINPRLRAIFIWYNVEPIKPNAVLSTNRVHDIEVFNRLNRGKIGLTDSELIKALFLLCLKAMPASTGSLLNPDTLVRTWDDMGKKLQNDELWSMICPKNKYYPDRMDLLFDFIKDNHGSSETAYRYYYNLMRYMLTAPDVQLLARLWNEVKFSFDKICKWNSVPALHNRVGFLTDCGETISQISIQLDKGVSLNDQIKKKLNINYITDIEDLDYHSDTEMIRMVLLLFNVLTCDKYGQKFPYNLYRDNAYDIEHINSQTDNPIEKMDEKRDWIINHAFSCLKEDRLDMVNGCFTLTAKNARSLIIEGIQILRYFKQNGQDKKPSLFAPYRAKVESYYAQGAIADKDSIGNLTLLNSSINREYKNALFPHKLRVLKRSDQEGAYIPLCTKYLFLKYYSRVKGNPSAFSVMRWREEDQRDYIKAIQETIKNIL